MPDAVLTATQAVTSRLRQDGRMKGLVVAAACAGLALAGCSHDTGDLDAPGSPVARWDWDQSSGEDGLLEGNLALIDGCLYVVSESNPQGASARTLAAFPRALASWDNTSETLTYSGVAYGIGDFVSAGGGWHAPSDNVTIPSACRPDEYGEVMLVQTTDLKPYVEEGD